MKRTPARVAAAAALGLVWGLALQARAPALHGDVSPHTVAVTWLAAGAPSAAEVDASVSGAAWESHGEMLPVSPGVPEHAEDGGAVRRHALHPVLVLPAGCPGAAADDAVPDLRRS